jgi:hypothetical protein
MAKITGDACTTAVGPNVPQELTRPEAARSFDNGDLRGEAIYQTSSRPTMTRVDAPHEAAELAREAEAGEPMPAQNLVADESICEQIGLQAAQLAAHLRNRQEELDHRESELNAWIARLESDTRSARLWLDQHETDLTSRGEVLVQQQRELATQREALAKSEEELARGCRELQEREEGLAKQEREVKTRLARLAVVEASQQRQVSVSDTEKAEELRHASEALDKRQQWLDEAERRLAASQADAEGLCAQLAADRREYIEQSTALRRQIDAERREAMAEIDEKRQAMQRRARHVDECAAALRQLRGELLRVHQETLEIRLATEELWARLSGVAPPAALTQSLGRIRSKIGEQRRQAQTEISEQKKELETIRCELAVEHEKLAERKRQFEQWVAASQEDCRQQAERLVAREQEYQEREIVLRQQAQRWQAERLRYQLELGRLQSQGSKASQPSSGC